MAPNKSPCQTAKMKAIQTLSRMISSPRLNVVAVITMGRATRTLKRSRSSPPSRPPAMPMVAQTVITVIAVACERPLSCRWEAREMLVAPPTKNIWLVPKSSSQKARVCRTWRAVQSGSMAARAACVAGTGRSPSGARPMSSGRRRTSK